MYAIDGPSSQPELHADSSAPVQNSRPAPAGGHVQLSARTLADEDGLRQLPRRRYEQPACSAVHDGHILCDADRLRFTAGAERPTLRPLPGCACTTRMSIWARTWGGSPTTSATVPSEEVWLVGYGSRRKIGRKKKRSSLKRLETSGEEDMLCHRPPPTAARDGNCPASSGCYDYVRDHGVPGVGSTAAISPTFELPVGSARPFVR